jgi:hypothetical protein
MRDHCASFNSYRFTPMNSLRVNTEAYESTFT